MNRIMARLFGRRGRSVISMSILLAMSANVEAQIATGSFSDGDAAFLQRIAEPVVNARNPTGGTDNGDAAGQRRELLLMEPRMLEKDAVDQREADIYIYDYATDEVIHIVIDMVDRGLKRSERIRNMQLPLVQSERDTAVDIAFRDEENRQLLNSAFLDATGRTLDSIQEIKYKAFVFLAASVSEQRATNVRECGVHRCAKLLLYTADDMALDLSPIIDLSSRRVLQITDSRLGG